jgi:hypothetical protein
MSFDLTIDFNMKFRYSLIMNDPQIDEKYPNSPQIHPFRVVGMKIWTKWPTPIHPRSEE